MERERLSEAGERRRVEMLGELQGELARVKRVRARREVVGGVAVALVACAAVGLALTGLRRASVPLPPPIVAQEGSSTPGAIEAPDASPVAAGITVAIVRTDPDAVLRLDARPRMAGLSILTDAELLRELRAAGNDCGLVKMEGRAWLTCDLPSPRGRFGG